MRWWTCRLSRRSREVRAVPDISDVQLAESGEVLGPEAYVALRTSVTGTGSANVTVNVFLDLRG